MNLKRGIQARRMIMNKPASEAVLMIDTAQSLSVMITDAGIVTKRIPRGTTVCPECEGDSADPTALGDCSTCNGWGWI